jgi:hypothetical protein
LSWRTCLPTAHATVAYSCVSVTDIIYIYIYIYIYIHIYIHTHARGVRSQDMFAEFRCMHAWCAPWWSCMFVCVCVCTYLNQHEYAETLHCEESMRACSNVHVRMCTFECACSNVHVLTGSNTCSFILSCVYTFMCVYTHVCIHSCVYSWSCVYTWYFALVREETFACIRTCRHSCERRRIVFWVQPCMHANIPSSIDVSLHGKVYSIMNMHACKLIY